MSGPGRRGGWKGAGLFGFPSSGTTIQAESSHTRQLKMELARAWPDSKWWKNHGTEYSERGLPDIMGVVDGHLYAFEIKIGNNWFSEQQIARLRELTIAGATAAGLIHINDVWYLVYVHSMGHKHDRRRNEWILFQPTDLIFYRSELCSGMQSDD